MKDFMTSHFLSQSPQIPRTDDPILIHNHLQGLYDDTYYVAYKSITLSCISFMLIDYDLRILSHGITKMSFIGYNMKFSKIDVRSR